MLGALERIPFEAPADQPGTTWLLLGSDSRDVDLPAAEEVVFGSEADVPGARADVVVLLHEGGGRRSATSIPRDLLLERGDGTLRRAAILFQDGPQAVADGLCRTLGVAVDHVAVLDAQGFVTLTEEVGPVTVRIDRPRRDADAGLLLATAGDVALDGGELLALVRSRNAEELVDGRWVPETDGAAHRATAAVDVLGAIRAALADTAGHPGRLHRLVAALAPDVAVDDDASPLDLLRLGRSGRAAEVGVLPTASAGGDLAVVATADAPAALARAGLGTGCRAPVTISP